jgi:Tol biopolymer transport system component
MRLSPFIVLLFASASTFAAEPKLLYVASTGMPANIEILLAAGEVPTNLSNNAGIDAFPVWSPSGKKIAFSSTRAAGKSAIYVMNADGSDVTKVSDEAANSTAMLHCPSWSSDGESIAYQRREGNTSQLLTVEIESGRVRNLTDNAWDPHWSPRGDKIVFTGLGEKGWNLYTIEPDGAKRTEIHTSEGKVGFVYPTWSPDGKRIAFTTAAGDAFEVHVCDGDGANVKQLTKEGRMNTHSVWLPDGKSIAFWHDVDGSKWQWKTVEIESGKIADLKEVPAAAYLHGARVSFFPKK